MWDLVAVVGRTIKFVNYRTRKVENEIKFSKTKENETNKLSSIIPLYSKVRLNQMEMIVIGDDGSIFLINLMNFEYDVIDGFFAERIKSGEKYKSVFNDFENWAKKKDTSQILGNQENQKQLNNTKFIERKILKEKKRMFNSCFDISNNFKYLVFYQEKIKYDDTNEKNKKGTICVLKREEERNLTDRLSIKFQLNYKFKIQFEPRIIKVLGNKGEVMILSNKNILQVLKKNNKEEKILEFNKAHEKEKSFISIPRCFKLSKDESHLFISFGEKKLQTFELKNSKIIRKNMYKLNSTPVCIGISSNGKTVGIGAVAGEKNIFFNLKKSVKLQTLHTLLKDDMKINQKGNDLSSFEKTET